MIINYIFNNYLKTKKINLLSLINLYLQERLSSTSNIRMHDTPKIMEIINCSSVLLSSSKNIYELTKIDSLINLVVKKNKK